MSLFGLGAKTAAANVKVHGTVKKGFEKVRDAFVANFSPDLPCHEVGATFAAYSRGEQVVSLWGGYADAAKRIPWQEHTIVNSYSSTKGVTACCLAMIHSRGLLDYEAPVAKYWPEFAANGKGKITVSEALSHRGGLSGLREPTTIDDICNWPVIIRKLEAAAPLWEPGSIAGYHALTWGFLAGEILHRITGKTVGAFLRDEVAIPIGADLVIGVRKDTPNPIADMIPPTGPETQTLADISEILKLTLGNPVIEAKVANEPRWRAAEIPAANGHNNAEGLARLYSAFANGGSFKGKSLVSPAAIATSTKEVFRGVDMNLGKVIGWSAGGFFLNNEFRWYGPHDQAFGQSGWGGSYGFADPVQNVGVGYVPNQMDTNLQGDPRAMRLIAALYDCL